MTHGDGEQSARAELPQRLEALQGPLRRYFAREVRDAAEIDDLVQDVSLRILKRGAIEELEQFDGYVFVTASSVLKDRNRRRMAQRSDRHVSFDPDLHSGVVPGPEAQLQARETLREVSAVLRELPERTRAVFIMRRLDGLAFAEIADRLGLSVSATEKHMLKASRYLLRRLGALK
ncbi:MAG TPA: RNA polymerase sigma factor [Novosphingobium sp.]|nr:RNA polymerase sigma factor [Novosphingobium sp.]